MNDQQKQLASLHPAIGHLMAQIDTLYQSLPSAVQKAYDAMQVPAQYGCTCELAEGETPDECVLNNGDIDDCVHAKKGMSPHQCTYYVPTHTLRQNNDQR